MNKQETINLFNLLLTKNGLEVELEKSKNELSSMEGELTVAKDIVDNYDCPEDSSVMVYSKAIISKYERIKNYIDELKDGLKEVNASIDEMEG